MRILLFMAMSLNGLIAGKDGNENFLSDTNWKCFGELAKKHGCFIVGRKTYETVQAWPEFSFDDIDATAKIVVSGDRRLKLEPPFLLADSPQDALRQAAALKYESAILTGGSTTNSAFMSEQLIDEVILNIEPVVVGSGIPLFSERDFERRLSFIASEKIADGILQVRYRINKS